MGAWLGEVKKALKGFIRTHQIRYWVEEHTKGGDGAGDPGGVPLS